MLPEPLSGVKKRMQLFQRLAVKTSNKRRPLKGKHGQLKVKQCNKNQAIITNALFFITMQALHEPGYS